MVANAVDAMGSGRMRCSSGPKGAGLRRMHDIESCGSLSSAGVNATENAGRDADELT
jgi:hypothetical protein